jgi:hypothetical protein
MRSFGVVGLSERFKSLLLMMAFLAGKFRFIKVQRLNSPFPDPGLVEMLSEHFGSILSFTSSEELFEEPAQKRGCNRKTRIICCHSQTRIAAGVLSCHPGVGRFLLSAVSAI